MDKYCVKLSPRALLDLDRIYDYIAKNLLEPGIAAKLIDEIEKSILGLDILPYRFSERKIGVYANRGYRQMFVKNYTVIYRVDENEKIVVVITVRYSPSQF